MITAKQAIKVCILSDFLTSKGLPIRVFKYSEVDKLIRIEAGFRDKQIRMVINQNGRFKYV